MIVIIFGVFFFYLQFSANEEFSISLSEANTEVHEFTDYLLNVKFRTEEKETTIKQLSSLYCNTTNKNLLEYLERAVISLAPKPSSVSIFCGKQKIDDCTKLNKETADVATIIKTGNVDTSLIQKFPALNPELNNCIGVGVGKKQKASYSDLSFLTPPVSKSHEIPVPLKNIKIINSKELFEKTINSEELWYSLISPSKDLWFMTEDELLCSPINDGCSKFYKKEEVIKCKGDYLICKK